jgi:hypothetical protein
MSSDVDWSVEAQRLMATKRTKAVKAVKAVKVVADGNGSGAAAAAAPALPPKKCASKPCSKKFTPTKEWQLYCSSTCSHRERGRRERQRYREMRQTLAKAGKSGRKSK